ncbi:type II toxin-antitoxin system VapC family toxin [Curtobacterium sp. NPDC089689]|uniref:type II toxin-antitoxin system VapC family toxin n=1 Tax=Curtobacterium sp. NPDC089689 TaxID=3363968 RepID=UPI0037F97C5A
MNAAPGAHIDFGCDGVLTFDECTGPIDRVLLDPAFIFRALVASEPGHENAAAFLAHLDLHETAMIVSSVFEVELLDIVDHLGRPELVEAWQEHLRSSSVHVVPLDGVLPDVKDLMSAAGVPVSVALQIVTAWAAGASAVVTTRAAFASVGELPLCVSNDTVAAVRALRS